MEKKGIYLPFDVFMKRRKYRYNKMMFENDIMYRAKIWKAHRIEYKRVCEDKKWFNDYNKFESEVDSYELRLRNLKN